MDFSVLFDDGGCCGSCGGDDGAAPAADEPMDAPAEPAPAEDGEGSDAAMSV